MTLSWKLPRYPVRYKLTNDYGVIICSYVYDLLISENDMKEAYMILRSVDVVLVIKVGKIVGVNFMTHYVENMFLKFDHLKFNGANISNDSSNKIRKV